jgi:hypothetical protein
VVALSQRPSSQPEDQVIRQDPVSGEAVQVGTEVGLVISTGELAIEGQITSPESGEEVGDTIAVDGKFSTSIPPGLHVWLAVEVADGLFPKEPEISSRFTAARPALDRTQEVAGFEPG